MFRSFFLVDYHAVGGCGGGVVHDTVVYHDDCDMNAHQVVTRLVCGCPAFYWAAAGTSSITTCLICFYFFCLGFDVSFFFSFCHEVQLGRNCLFQ